MGGGGSAHQGRCAPIAPKQNRVAGDVKSLCYSQYFRGGMSLLSPFHHRSQFVKRGAATQSAPHTKRTNFHKVAQSASAVPHTQKCQKCTLTLCALMPCSARSGVRSTVPKQCATAAACNRPFESLFFPWLSARLSPRNRWNASHTYSTRRMRVVRRNGTPQAPPKKSMIALPPNTSPHNHRAALLCLSQALAMM